MPVRIRDYPGQPEDSPEQSIGLWSARIGIFREAFPPASYDFKPTVEISPLAPAGPQILGEGKARNTLKNLDGKAHMPSLEWDKSEVSLVNTFIL